MNSLRRLADGTFDSPGFRCISLGSSKNAAFDGSVSLRKQKIASTSIGDVLSMVNVSRLLGYTPARILQRINSMCHSDGARNALRRIFAQDQWTEIVLFGRENEFLVDDLVRLARFQSIGKDGSEGKQRSFRATNVESRTDRGSRLIVGNVQIPRQKIL